MHPAGSWALVKTSEREGVEEFSILYVDPEKAARPGYMWNSADMLTEQQAASRLGEMGIDAAALPALLQRARAHFTGLNG